jgi:hypothetical protein
VPTAATTLPAVLTAFTIPVPEYNGATTVAAGVSDRYTLCITLLTVMYMSCVHT